MSRLEPGSRHSSSQRPPWPLWVVALSLIGACIAAYLWRAKTGAAALVCGPFGDCQTVNTSPYSEIAGIPVAAAGTLGYLSIGLAALAHWRTPTRFTAPAGFGLSLAGALFSLYLTGIEAFILHQYCVWCLTSWVLITAIAVLWGWFLFRERDEHPTPTDAARHASSRPAARDGRT